MDRIAEIWGERTPFGPAGEWAERVDSQLEVAEGDVERWVQSARVLCSNGCALDIAVADGQIVGVWAARSTASTRAASAQTVSTPRRRATRRTG